MKLIAQRASGTAEGPRRRTSKGAPAMAVGIGVVIFLGIGYFVAGAATPFLSGDVLANKTSSQLAAEHDRAAQYAAVALADTEDVWTMIFEKEIGEEYTPPTLVLYRDSTTSPCSEATGASGPFYCGADSTAYLDTAFFVELERRLSPKGDFAAAYVVAHEVAHHIQNEVGILGEAEAIRRRVSEVQSELMAVRVELQAECYSGVWARHARGRIGTVEPQDVEKAMKTALQIGIDTQESSSGKKPMPHAATYGTLEQRQAWFQRGYQSASIRMCDSFATNDL